MTQIIITVDLGYGDSGKGTIIDALARKKPTELVVRYSGGAQAAHNVLSPEGIHHKFSQFCSGTLIPGVKSYLGPEVLIDVNKLLVENTFLKRAGVHDGLQRLTVDKKAPLITEFNVFINQTREFLRGDRKHGSCGMGIYETRLDSRAYRETMLCAEDMLNLERAKEKLLFFREVKRKMLFDEFPSLFNTEISPKVQGAYSIFTDDAFIDETLNLYSELARSVTIADEETLATALATGRQVLFEASQGVLIDESHGFLPNVTGSDVTTHGAHRLLTSVGTSLESYTLGITRCYMFRHGAGPLPSEDSLFNEKILEQHNFSHHPWQGKIRYGWFDPLLIRYAMKATGGVNGLAVTCLDQVPVLGKYNYVTSYKDPYGESCTDIPDQTAKTDLQKTLFTEQLRECTPQYATTSPNKKEVLEIIATTCNIDIAVTSEGQTATEKEFFF